MVEPFEMPLFDPFLILIECLFPSKAWIQSN